MKQLIYIVFSLIIASNVLVGCDATENDLESGWDVNRSDSSNVTVDTLQGIDVSMYEKARVFPGLVDTLKEARIKDTLISLDLSQKYVSMQKLGLKVGTDTREMPQPIYSTGLYAGAGELITITVPDNLWGLTAQIGVQTDDLSRNNAGLRESIVYTRKTLYPGKNTVRSPLGGYLWIVRDPNKIGDTQAILKVGNAYAAPDFILGKTNPRSWAERVKLTTVPWLELRGEHFAFSVDRQHMRQYLATDAQFPEKMEKALTVWDGLISKFYDSFGFKKDVSDDFYRMPKFQDRFVFDVQLVNNTVAHINNPQALMMVQNNRLYDNLVYLDSVSSLNIAGVYRQLRNKYKPHYYPFSTYYSSGSSFSTADIIPLYRQAEENVKHGLSKNVGDLFIGLSDNAPEVISYAAADSTKDIGHDIGSYKNVAAFLQMLQLVKYAAHYRNEPEWQFYSQLWSDCRKENVTGVDDSYFFRKLCEHYATNFTPFFEHWGVNLTDAIRANASQYPLLDKAIWKIDPFADDPFAKVVDIDASKFKYKVGRSRWEIMALDKDGHLNEANNYPAANLIDNNKGSSWCNFMKGDDSPYELPYYILIDMGQYETIDGFYFANGYNGDKVTGFKVQTTSGNNFHLQEHAHETWTTLGEVGTAAAPQNGHFNEQFFKFQNGPHTVRYLRLVFDRPNNLTPEKMDKTQAYFDKNHYSRRQEMYEFGVYYYRK